MKNFPNHQEFVDHLTYNRLLSPETIKNYTTFLRLFLEFLNKDINDANQSDIRDFIKWLNLKNRKSSTIKEYIAALRIYYKYKKNIDLSFFLDNTIRLKRENTVPKIISHAEIDTLKSTMLAHKHVYAGKSYGKILRDIALIEMLKDIGPRSKEIRKIRVCDIDFVNRSVIILHGKGGHQRYSIFGDSTLKSLNEHINHNNLMPNDFIFGFSKSGINQILRRWAKKAKINPLIHSHCFRHYHITEAQRRGVNVQAVADQVGHTSLNTTRHYTHLDLSFRKEQYKIYNS